MCCENRAEIRPVIDNVCIRTIDRNKLEEAPYAAMMHMKYQMPNGTRYCRTFGLTGQQMAQMEQGLQELREEQGL